MKKTKKEWQKVKFLVLDFDGVMTDNRISVSEDGKESVFCNRTDSLRMGTLKNKGVEIIVISTEKNKVVKARCRKLKIKCLSNISDKYQAFLREVKKRNLKLNNVCYVGNDINDFRCIKNAGIGVVVADSHKSVLGIADYITEKKGGEGAVREVIDLILGSEP